MDGTRRRSSDAQASEVQEMIEYLHDTAADSLGSCGSSVVSLFRAAARNNLSSQSALRRLVALAEDKLLSHHYKSVPVCWRQLYTDASILLAVALSLKEYGTDALRGIKSLDMALIIAGAPGARRKAFIFDLISKLQESCAKHYRRLEWGLPKLIEGHTSATALRSTASMAIPTISPAQANQLTSLCRPLIVRGGAAHWPAATKWRSLSYIQRQAGPGRCVPVEVGHSYTSATWTQRIMPFDDFLGHLTKPSVIAAEVLYLAQYNLFSQIPELRNDIAVPDQVYTILPECSSYQPPSTSDGLDINAWLGPKGTTSPAHTDPYFNAFAQVVGRKHVWVAGPEHHSLMTSVGKEPKAVGSNDLPPAATSLMDNTCSIDVFDISSPASDTAFRLAGMAEAEDGILYPGDILLMPPLWWHALRSLDVSFSVSIWF